MNSKEHPGTASHTGDDDPDLDRGPAPPPVTGHNNKRGTIGVNDNDTKRKRRRRDCYDAYPSAYRGFTFTPVPATGRPGTPHRFFAESYTVEYIQPLDEDSDDKSAGADHTCSDNDPYSNNLSTIVRNMRVHRHANGLCVVTTAGNSDAVPSGDVSATTGTTISTIHDHAETKGDDLQWLCCAATTLPDLSAAQKRKRAAVMLKQKQQRDQTLPPGAVRPRDPLIRVVDTATTTGGVPTIYPSLVFGGILEVNMELTMDLLRSDPLLKGYLAVILPTGPFPPPTTTVADSTQSPDTVAEPIGVATEAIADTKGDTEDNP